MDEMRESTTASLVKAVPGREPWIASFDLAVAMQSGPAALRLKQAVDNETLSIAEGPGWRALFDGTLYNGQALSAALLPGVRMASNAQLVGAAYRRWGDKFLSHIEGIFAFLVVDQTRERFLAVRDRLGFQPLFYAENGETVLFSDSILALRHDSRLSISLNRAALADLLSRRFPDERETYFTEIRRLSPACQMEINLSSKLKTFATYWDPSPPGTPDDSMREADLEQFEWLFEQAVRRSLKFGNAGIFLSGGLDSVSVGAVAADLSAREGWVKPWALSVAFPDSESNEEPIQRAVASGLGLPQIVLPFAEGAGSEGLFWTNMRFNCDLAAPVHNPWRTVYQQLMRQAKEKNVKVIMTGGGGDDWLTVNSDYMADLLRQFDLMNSYRFTRSTLGSYRAPRLAIIRFMYWNSGIRPLLTRQLRRMGRSVAPERLNDLRYKKLARAKQTPDWVAEDPHLRQEMERRIEQSIQREMDRPEPSGPYGFYKFSAVSQTFAHFLISLSQEEDFEIGRQMGMRILHPYWDSQLVQFLCNVPPRLLLRGGREKGLVRQSVARRFPNLGFEKQKKVRAGAFFRSLVEQEGPEAWRRIGGAKSLTDLGIVKRSAIEDVMRQSYPSDEIFTSFRVWEVLNLESWVRAHS